MAKRAKKPTGDMVEMAIDLLTLGMPHGKRLRHVMGSTGATEPQAELALRQAKAELLRRTTEDPDIATAVSIHRLQVLYNVAFQKGEHRTCLMIEARLHLLKTQGTAGDDAGDDAGEPVPCPAPGAETKPSGFRPRLAALYDRPA